MGQSYLCGRAVAAVAGVYHLVVGLTLMLSGDAAISAARVLGGMTVTGSPELGILGEVLACYLLAFGAMMLAVAYDPVKNRAGLSIGVILYALRAIQRAAFSGKVMSVFQMSPARYWGMLIVIVGIGAALAFFRWRIHQDMGRPAAQG